MIHKGESGHGSYAATYTLQATITSHLARLTHWFNGCRNSMGINDQFLSRAYLLHNTKSILGTILRTGTYGWTYVWTKRKTIVTMLLVDTILKTDNILPLCPLVGVSLNPLQKKLIFAVDVDSLQRPMAGQ